MIKNIIFIGFMGVGKTTYAKKLSKALDMQFIDTDRYIEETEGISVSEIFKVKGESYFRQREAELVLQISQKDSLVIATGGGIIKNPENMRRLKQSGIVVYLEASPERILCNLKDDCSRPLLEGENKLQKIKSLMCERQKFYEEYSDITFNVNNNVSCEKMIKDLEAYYEGVHNTRSQP